MSSNDQTNDENKNNKNPNKTETEAPKAPTKLNPTHIAKAKLLRQKLREKKNKEQIEKNQDLATNEVLPNILSLINDNNSPSNNNNDENKPEIEKIDPLKFMFSDPSENYNDNSLDGNQVENEENNNIKENLDKVDNSKKVVKEEILEVEIQKENSDNKKQEEEIINKNCENPSSQITEITITQNNINQEEKSNFQQGTKNINNIEDKLQKENSKNNILPVNPSSEISIPKKPEENNLITTIPPCPSPPPIFEKKEEPIKQIKFPNIIIKKDSDSSSSSSDDDFDNREAQRLMNTKFAQENLFKKANKFPNNNNNNINNLFSPKKKEPDFTKEEVLEKLILDLDKDTNLKELDDKKKQIMLKKMRKTLHRISNLMLKSIDPIEDETKNLINKKIEELKNLAGNDYDKIKENVDKIVSNLKMPDFYFNDDDDVERISDDEQKGDLCIKHIENFDFISYFRN